MDINSDGKLNISDVYLTFLKANGRTWNPSVTTHYLFNSSDWNTISTSTGNIKTTYPGTQSLTINNVKTNQVNNIYLLRTGMVN